MKRTDTAAIFRFTEADLDVIEEIKELTGFKSRAHIVRSALMYHRADLRRAHKLTLELAKDRKARERAARRVKPRSKRS